MKIDTQKLQAPLRKPDNPVKVVAEAPLELSDSKKRIINKGGCLYPNFRMQMPPLPTKCIAKVDAYTLKQGESGPTDSDKRIINGGGCLFPNTDRLNVRLDLREPAKAGERTDAGDQRNGSSNGTPTGSGASKPRNFLNTPMPGDIAPVTSASLTQPPNPGTPSKPGWLSRSASFLAGEFAGLATTVGTGVVDVAKFLYDVEAAVIARGHDLVFEGTLSGSYTEVYAPTSSFGTASSEGRGGEAVLKIVTEAPDRIRDASIKTGILLEEGKYYEAGMSFGAGPLAEATAALGTLQVATSTPVASGSFRLAGSVETPPPAPALPQTPPVRTTPVVLEAAPVKVTAPPVLAVNPFSQAIAAARDFAGGIAGDCEAASQSIRGSIPNGMRGTWSYRNAQGPGFHEFVQLPDGTILDATAGQFLAKGQVTTTQLAGVEGLNAAIESGVFTLAIHEALRALVAR